MVLLHETETAMLQLELQRGHLDVYGLPWAVVSQLDDQYSAQGWCVKELESVQGWGETGCELCTPAALQCSQGLAVNSATG